MTTVTSRELETLLQLACFHYLTAVQVEGFLFEGSSLRSGSRAVITRRILAGLVRDGRLVVAGGSSTAQAADRRGACTHSPQPASGP